MSDIFNSDPKNNPAQHIYDSFNSFIFSNDIRIMGKLLHRFSFFEKTKHLAGDIVEVGVFKGSGVASWLKMVEIYMPHSNRKVIGFDIFDSKDNIFTSFIMFIGFPQKTTRYRLCSEKKIQRKAIRANHW